MFLSTLTALALALPAAPHDEDQPAKLPWFEGSYEELLAKAGAEERLIFVDFWTEWCTWCKRLDKDTFSNPEVVSAMQDILCYSVDAESRAGRPLASHFNVTGFPALILLNPDGSLRDQIGGYLPPDAFLQEIDRVVRNEGTVSALRDAVASTPDDLEARYALARRLRQVGDHQGHSKEVAAILERDLERTSVVTQRVALDTLVADINRRRPDPVPLTQFLDGKTEPEILARGHRILASIHRYNAHGREDEVARRLRRKMVASYRLYWANAPAEERAGIGQAIARALWEDREKVDDAARAFALDVARETATLAPDDAQIVDTLACAFFMNGEVEAALRENARCIELQPDQALWQERRASFSAGS
jgi:thioredoxin-related protein